MSRLKAYVIQNPHADYAVEFMRRIRERFGYTPLCLFTHSKRQYYKKGQYPDVAALAPDTRFDVDLKGLPRLAAKLRAKYDVVGLVPFSETALNDAPRLLELFGLGWNEPEVIARFRDKHAFKAHVAKRGPGIRLNRTLLVRRPGDLDAELPEKFVLKPNDGFSSVGVGVFGRDTSKAKLRAHLAANPGRTFLLEEFVSGDVYTICGMADEKGAMTVVAVSRSLRVSANGSEVLYGDGWLIHRSDPIFKTLEDYAVQVMGTTGLRRCPFHLEVIVDERGPCLIEAAARIIGGMVTRAWTMAHGGRFDFFSAAAHSYLSSEPYGDLGLDWEHYDSVQLLRVYGVSRRAGWVCRVEGAQALEKLPEFAFWLKKPVVGERMRPTVNLETVPYSFVLMGKGTLARLRELGEKAKSGLKLETEGHRMLKLKMLAERKAGRWRLFLGWLLRRGLSPFR